MTAVLIVVWVSATGVEDTRRYAVESALGCMFSAQAIIAAQPDDGSRVKEWRCK